MKKITQEELKKNLIYDRDTGLFTNRKSRGTRAICGDKAGYAGVGGYVTIAINKQLYLAHRLAWLYVYGYMPELSIDHIDGDTSNNKIKNLRNVSQQCNCRNRKLSKKNTTGVTGVRWNSGTKSWQVSIGLNGTPNTILYSKNLVKAVRARWDAEKKHNFPNCTTTSTAYKYLKSRNLINIKDKGTNKNGELK